MNNEDDVSSRTIITGGAAIGIFLVVTVGGLLYGCPQYNVYSSRMDGQATMAQAQGSRMALVSQATAEKDAAVLRAEAANERVAGWVQAAKDGCAKLGLTGDKDCLTELIRDNYNFSLASEGSGSPTVILSNGISPPSIQVRAPQ